MKVILVNTPNGQYTIPLETVAEDRAQYVRHRKQDTHGDGAQK